MPIAFAGKDGSGRATLSAPSARHLAHPGADVPAVDGDIDQQPSQALDPAPATPGSTAPPLAAHLDDTGLLRGANPRIASRAATIRTTLPGRGSRLLHLPGDDELHAGHVQQVGGVPLMVTGAFGSAHRGAPTPLTSDRSHRGDAPGPSARSRGVRRGGRP